MPYRNSGRSRGAAPAHAASTPGQLLVAFGDSITWGANASDNTTSNYQSVLPLSDRLPGAGDNTYPGDLGRALQRTVYDYGYPGQTTQTDLPRLKNVLSDIQPKTILLMEGTNDVIGGRSMSNALAGLQTEVNTISGAGVTVVLLTTTPTCYPADSQYYARDGLIQQYDAGVRQIAASSQVRLVDVDQAFQQSGECAQLTVRRDGSNDYLHPNDAGNTLIAQTVASVVNLVVGIDHTSGVPGSSATITGSNLEPQEPVSAVWDCPTDACTGGTVIGTGTADASGKVTVPVTIPASATPGTQHVIGVMGQDTGAFGTVTFAVTRLSVHRTGAMLVLSWQLARPAAVIGFNLYGGARRLNARMIATHAGHRYHFVTGRSGASRYLLDVLLESGKRVGVRFPAVR